MPGDPSGTRRGAQALPLASIVLLAWTTGALVTFVKHRGRLAVFQRDARDAPAADAPPVRARVDEWRARFRIRRPVRAVVVAGMSPYTLGMLRPIVAIPRRFLQPGGDDVLEAVVAHELAHVARWDAAVLGLQNLLGTIYFFNPAIWIANRQLNLARECVCDGMVLAHRTLTPFEYGRGLLAVLRDQAGGACGEVTGIWTATTACRDATRRSPGRSRCSSWRSCFRWAPPRSTSRRGRSHGRSRSRRGRPSPPSPPPPDRRARRRARSRGRTRFQAAA
jgi:beta-lactamase regulating signal transducer with metallopeptidase domain